MKFEGSTLRLAATDLSNHLSCPHVTTLDLSAARGEVAPPQWRAPDLVVIQELGLKHEAAYIAFLQTQGGSFTDLRDVSDEARSLAETRSHMERGTHIIAQGKLRTGRWFGQPDVLRRVPAPGNLGAWSYEAYDCKLSRETKAATILQLSLYSALLTEIQGREPEFMHVVRPGCNFTPESYRLAEYAAYFRYIRKRLEDVTGAPGAATYPEPCEHCNVCRWFRECDQHRRADDHLSLVAGISRLQRNQLVAWDVPTVAKLAVMPIPLRQRPLHGSRETYERTREQARVQVEGRQKNQPVHETLPIVPEQGLCRLPEPSPSDIFLDFESDPFAEGGELQYLFGFTTKDASGAVYEKRWCLNPSEEKQAFEWLVDFIMARWQEAPCMHVYHFGAHESSALKSMMGRHATREDQVDRMLRALVLVDLHTIVKQSVRASVEEYSLKKLEPFHGFIRNTSLDASRTAMRVIEHSLQLGRVGGPIDDKPRATMEGYNREDCLSTESLRDWLESLRGRSLEQGSQIPRPPLEPGDPSEDVDEHQQQVAALVARLIDSVPAEPADRSHEQSARWLLAQLLDFHRREAKASWWEGYRLAELDDDQLLDEPSGLSGLRFVNRLLVERKIPVDRYSFPAQEAEARAEDKLYLRGQAFGTVEAIDPAARTIDVKKTKKTADIHPRAAYVWDRPVDTKKHANALLKIGEWVA